jgi:hypothetical protein
LRAATIVNGSFNAWWEEGRIMKPTARAFLVLAAVAAIAVPAARAADGDPWIPAVRIESTGFNVYPLFATTPQSSAGVWGNSDGGNPSAAGVRGYGSTRQRRLGRKFLV